MKFDGILEYQKIDQELIAMESEFANSKERRNLMSTQKELEDANATIKKLTADAIEVIGSETRLKEKLNGLRAKLDDFDGVIEDIEATDEADYYLKQIEGIVSEIVALEKELSRETGSVDLINAEFNKTWEQGIKANKAYGVAREAYNAYCAEQKPKVEATQNKLKEIKKNIPDEFLTAYTSLRSAKKKPAFVEYDAKDCTCGGCRMDMPADTKSKLKVSGDYAECPNCRRINYIP